MGASHCNMPSVYMILYIIAEFWSPFARKAVAKLVKVQDGDIFVAACEAWDRGTCGHQPWLSSLQNTGYVYGIVRMNHTWGYVRQLGINGIKHLHEPDMGFC